MPRGHRLSIYALFSGKERISTCISREKGDRHYIQTRHNDLFSHYNLFLGKLKEKLARKYSLNPINSIWLPYGEKGLLILLSIDGGGRRLCIRALTLCF